jgi:sporulation protein YlmC with PRC-barrel domain
MLKKLLVTTAVGGLMIGAAAAQNAPAPAEKPMTPPAATAPAPSPSAAAPAGQAGSPQVVNAQKPDQWLASNFRGTDVLGSDNEKIGDVSDILFDKTGKIEAFVVSMGGFLGMGAKDVAIAPASFEVVAGDKSKNEADKLKVSMTKEQLKQVATFEPYKEPRTTTGAGGTSPRPAPAPAPAAR